MAGGSNTEKAMENPDTVEPELNPEEIKKKATLLLLQGKRSIYIRDYQAALVALCESCQLFSQIYPEQDDALADPYFYYGKALLEVARNESDVLGDQVQEEGDDDDDEDEEEDENNDDDNKENGSKTEEKSNNGTDQSEESKNEEQTKGEKNSKENGEDENGEINDLQLSWEYLELAKLIYLKKADGCKETAVKLAETYLCLGENGLESENYSTAILDIQQALQLQKKHLKEDDRRIAETLYQLGVAYSLDQNYDEAVVSFNKAIEQLNKKIASLEVQKASGNTSTEEKKDAFYTIDGEISEIKTVIKDVEEKIKDMIESKNKLKAELLTQVYGDGQGSSSSTKDIPPPTTTTPAGSSTVTVSNISHLIKRKRKNEDDEAGDEKKLKTQN